MSEVLKIAKMIDHSLLKPTLTDAELADGCAVATRLRLASVCVKPYTVPRAAELVGDSDVGVGSVVGFPHGNSHVDIKIAEARRAMDEGATEIDVVVNLGKVVAKDWEYVRAELSALTSVCHDSGAIIKVIFENDLLPNDTLKIRLCEICSDCGCDFVKTSTGYNFTKGTDGKYSYRGATDSDLRLMRKHSAPNVQVKAAGGVGTLQAILRVRTIGVARIGTGQSVTIIDDAKAHFNEADYPQ
jgi:deoxyribose-phosphate aldolase